MTSWLDGLLQPIMVVVAWIMVQTHSFLTWLGFNPDGGWAWVLSIVALVLVMRIAMIPLFVKQIKASRGMQMVQPELQKIQAKYKGKTDPASRQKMSQETMELYRKHGTNPFSSCLPILLQSPFFFALFRVLYSLGSVAGGTQAAIGPLNQTLAQSAESATLFGAPLSSTFMTASGADAINIRIVSLCLIVAMTATTFITQRQLTFKNMPEAAKNNPMASQQKMIMYIMPLIYAFSGVTFPLGVLIYWLTTNLWSMGQQFYVIRKNPAPGSDAEKAMLARKAKHGKLPVAEDSDNRVIEGTVTKVGGQRVQPKRKSRQRPGAANTAANQEPKQTPMTPSPKASAGDAQSPGGQNEAATVKKAPQGPASERIAARRAAARQAGGHRDATPDPIQRKGQPPEDEIVDEVDVDEVEDELEDEADVSESSPEPKSGASTSGAKKSGSGAGGQKQAVRSASWERSAQRSAARKSGGGKSGGNQRRPKGGGGKK